MVSALKHIRRFLSAGNCQWRPIHIPTSSRSTKKNEFITKKKAIELEFQTLKDEASPFLPIEVPKKYWNYLLNIKSKSERMEFYKLLQDAEKRLENDKTRDEEKWEQNCEFTSDLFFEISESAMNSFYNCNSLDAILFGQKLVFDFDYDDVMNREEKKICITEFTRIYSLNKLNRDPFDIYFCNLSQKTELDQRLCQALPHLRTNECLFTVTEKSYLDFFQKEKLVYLTPHCDNELESFNYDDIYVIGALVTPEPNEAWSLAKSAHEGLRTARLPLDRYLHLYGGRKTLGMDQVYKILLTLKNTQSWYRAFENIFKMSGRE